MGLTVNSFLTKKLQGIDNGIDNGILEQHLSEFDADKNKKQQIWIVDVSLFLHRILRNNNDNNQHISGFLNLIAKLRSFNIHPIFVFDGKPNKHKKKKLNSRRKNREKSWKKKEELDKIIANSNEDLSSSIESLPENLQIEIQNKINEEEDKEDHQEVNKDVLEEITQEIITKEQIKLAKRCIKKTESHYQDLKDLFNYFNLPYIHLEDEEADIVCYSLSLSMNLDFKINCILSNDMDFLAYEYQKEESDSEKSTINISLIRDFNFKNDYVKTYNSKKIQKKLKLSNQQFTDFCILMGTDYNKPLGMDFTADIIYELIYKHKSIENILEYFKTLEQYKKIHDNLILYPDNKEDIIKKFKTLTQQSIEQENIEELINYLKEKTMDFKKIDTKFSYHQSRNIFKNSILIKKKDIKNYKIFVDNYLGNSRDNFQEKIKEGINYIQDRCPYLRYNLINKKIRQIYKYLNNQNCKRKNSYKKYNNQFSNWKINNLTPLESKENSSKNSTYQINNTSNNINKNTNKNTNITNNDNHNNDNTNDITNNHNNDFYNIDSFSLENFNITSPTPINLFDSSNKNDKYLSINNLKLRNNSTSPIMPNFNNTDILQETLFVAKPEDGFISISIDETSNNIIESGMCYV